MTIYTKHGLFHINDDVFRGKGISSLLSSRDRRDELLSLFGGRENVPSSVMRAKLARTGNHDPSVINGRRYQDVMNVPDTHDNNFNNIFRASGTGSRAGALSTFPQNIGKSVLLLFSEPGALVFDPFAGHNSRMELCVSNGRHYIGYDISTEFMKANRERAEYLQEHFPSAAITLHHADSRHCKEVQSSSADFTITSPPYFNIEYYGDEPEQLGKTKTYKEFLDALLLVVKENFRILRRGAYACWFVNDFRLNKKFHLYHANVCRLAETAGFEVQDLIVVDFGPGIRDAFTNQIVETKIIPKRHEYCLVFRKPQRDGLIRK